MRMKLVGAGVLALVCSHAMGQIVGEATWVWEVTTQDGDSLVEPGETAIVDLSIDMDPDVFTGPGDPIVVLGLFQAQWAMLGQQGASEGMIVDWTQSLDLFGGSNSDGINITDLFAFQTASPDNFVHDDPIPLLTFEWVPTVTGTYSVEYVTATLDQSVLVLTGTIAFGDLVIVEWPVNEAAVTFQVAPSPPTLAIGFITAMGAARRRE